jgi:uncharacterized damage-inducible protein DinB
MPADAREALANGASTVEALANSASTVEALAPLFNMVKGYIIAAAEQMPEDKYSYAPTPEVRNFGQILGHVAGAQYQFCGTATGGSAQPPEDFEERTTKAGLVEALKMGFAQCDAAYAMDDATAMEEAQLFGETGTRLWVLAYNLSHAWEHYGNIVTYMRENGLVPPSSQGGM